ncbi:OB-fold nucleic acid binding domain-containing protein, partial [Nocardia cyriacigeorgica]
EQRGTQVRLGLAAVRYIGDELAEKIVAAREESGPYTSLLDLTGRVELTVRQAESLATAGALNSITTATPTRASTAPARPPGTPAAQKPTPDTALPGERSNLRRTALWAAGAAAGERPDRLPGMVAATTAPSLPGMSALELAAADVWATGISPESYPTEFLRAELDAMGVIPADRLLSVPDGSRVLVGGAVTHRQRPATAAGVTFLNLEDETGMVNIVCSVGLWTRYRRLAQTARALIIRGRIQNAEGAVSVYAEQLRQLDLRMAAKSRDFR